MVSSLELQLLHGDLPDSFIDIRYLAGISSLFTRRQTIERDEQIMRSDKVYWNERKLLTLSNLGGPQNFVTSCSIAAIIFIDNHLRDIAFNARLIGRHVARLKLSIELFLDQPSNFTLCPTIPRTILWALYVGGIAAGNRPERNWFVTQLSERCDLLELNSWEDAEGVLKSFLWPLAWNSLGILLWECLEDAQIMRKGLRRANSQVRAIGKFYPVVSHVGSSIMGSTCIRS